MLTVFARLTKLFRSLEQKMYASAKNAGNRHRVKANDVMAKRKDTAQSMRESATELEAKAKADFQSALTYVESVLGAL